MFNSDFFVNEAENLKNFPINQSEEQWILLYYILKKNINLIKIFLIFLKKKVKKPKIYR